jgi:PAS domain S-box-containing protein
MPATASDVLPSSVYETLFSNTGTSVIVTDAAGAPTGPRIVAINATFTAMTGYTPDDVIGRSPRLLQGPKTDPRVIARLRAALASGTRFHGETTNYRKDGQEYVVEWTIDPVRDDAGTLTHYVAVQTDVSRRARLEAEVRQQHEYLRLVVDSLPDHAIVALDTEGCVHGWNASAQRLKGYAEAEIVGAHYRVFFTAAEQQSLVPEKNLARALREGCIDIEGWRVRRDGTRFWCKVTLSALRNREGELVGFVKVLRDRTEHRKALAERARMEAQIQQLHRLESLGLLAGGIAHDFNNVLAAMFVQVDFLSLGGQHQAAATENLRATCLRARDLVSRLLTFAKQGERRPERVELVALTRSIVKMLRPSLPSHITVTENQESDEVHAIGDATEWTQVVMNLCLNARDALGASRGHVTIGIRVEPAIGPADERFPPQLPSGAYAVLEVADNGPGMDPDTLRRIFDPFFTTKPAGKGTGLGLCIVHSIAEQWSGGVSVVSETGEGACFRVWVPLAAGAHAS